MNVVASPGLAPESGPPATRDVPHATRRSAIARDARGASYVDVAEPRLYSIARLEHPRTLKLSPDGAGLTIYELDFSTR